MMQHQQQHQQKNILQRYPDLLATLTTTIPTTNKRRRILRKDTDRIRKIKRLKQFEMAFLDAMDMNNTASVGTLFTCPICRNILRGPVTVTCGHTFCGGCVTAVQAHGKCVVCHADVDGGGFKCGVNVLVQELLEKWRERNKDINDNFDSLVPNTVDILGVEPRYHLRSRFSGLQLKTPPPDETLTNFKRRRQNSNKFRISPYHLHKHWPVNPDNFQTALDSIFKEVTYIKEKALRTSWDCIEPGDLDCILCSRCILDPVTTECGHTFCRGCLTRVLDHGLACPLCMSTLNSTDYSRGTTVILHQAIQFLLPVEYNERMSISLKDSSALEKGSDIPVFVCTSAYPGVACPLYVYEPRYRLLTRRCLNSSSKRFAIAGKDSHNSFVSYGTILEVKDALSLQDGRFILTTLGVRRFKVLSKEEQDGYDTAKVQYIRDAVVTAEKLPELTMLHQKVHNKASKWIRSFKPSVLSEVERLIGRMPKVEKNWTSLPDGPSWTWWLMPILPLSSQLQVGFLSTTSLEKRLRAIDKMLEHMQIRMRALERNTVNCAHPGEDPSDSCGVNEEAFDVPFNDN